MWSMSTNARSREDAEVCANCACASFPEGRETKDAEVRIQTRGRAKRWWDEGAEWVIERAGVALRCEERDETQRKEELAQTMMQRVAGADTAKPKIT